LDACQAHAISIQQNHEISMFQFKQRQKDPTHLIVIDLRSETDYKANPLKDAVNIPFAEVLNNLKLSEFKSAGKEVILYSGSLIESTQAWTLLTQMGYKNLFILNFNGASIINGELTGSASNEGNEALKYKFQADTSTNLE
jgi:rhodanese-related sulfurtransferase